MKTSIRYLVLLIFLIALYSCKKEFPTDPLAISDLTVSECKTEGENVNEFDDEYITIETVNDYYLLFNHINSIFNCEPGQITVSIGISPDSITIDQNESQSVANCICTYDISFRLGPLEYGTYAIIFQKGGDTFREYSLDYNKKTDVKIDI